MFLIFKVLTILYHFLYGGHNTCPVYFYKLFEIVSENYSVINCIDSYSNIIHFENNILKKYIFQRLKFLLRLNRN